jgi:SAM-dependent methyltransferase
MEQLSEHHRDLVAHLLRQGVSCSFSLRGKNMEPTIPDGSTVRLGPVTPEQLRAGDIVLLVLARGHLAFRRLLRIYRSRGQRWVLPGGDAYIIPDRPVPADQVLGRVEAVVTPQGTVTHDQLARNARLKAWWGCLRPWIMGWDIYGRSLQPHHPATAPPTAGSTESGDDEAASAHRSLNDNQLIYTDLKTVAKYADELYLFHEEEAILERFADRLPEMRMLDVGVGGGRTTVHFAPRVKQYLGIDSSPEMVAACEARFADRPATWSFAVGDVQAMDFLADGSFDFVLFSYLGLDTLPHEGRQVALREIRRVCAPGAALLFSSNNLQSWPSIMEPHWSKYPPVIVSEIQRQIRLRRLNRGRIARNGQYAELCDGAYGFRLRSHYARPRAQVAELEAAGFCRVEVLDDDGVPMPESVWDTTTEGGLHYLAWVAPAD